MQPSSVVRSGMRALSPRVRALLSSGLLGCAALALVPLGCSSATIRHLPDDRPRLPAATAERLRACVGELGGELAGGYYTFEATVKVDEEGRVVDVKSTGVPHPELAICMRIALRGMTVPEDLLGKLRVSTSPAAANGQTAAERGLVGNAAALVLVVVALAELVIDAAPVAVAIAAAVEVTGEIAETVKGKWSCTASCNVQQVNSSVSCPDRVTGTAYGPNEPAACAEAKRRATQSTPAGCYPRHCQCRCIKR
ncbi:hypothetical protein [Polyangium spumosum]|uniref:Uncharacterized protein n=1 Tax=Polyangium spumosum TaxID=889282 RepID=A0A6N7PUC7_9BACT|nr:hypothetical protein [Polyangium spumosum]MRG95658.1 hypothetical protein [Polyangium spumosum]